MVNLFQVVILSIVQGICEWFPISSSGHLAVLSNIFGFSNLSFDVFLHFSSILAVLILFYKDLIKLVDIRKKENLRYIGLIILGIIPAGIVGVLFKHQIEGFFLSMTYLGIFFIISGILIYSTKFFKVKKEKITWIDSIFIGVFQAIAILPGISRSGSTISGGIFRGLDKEKVLKFSFIMAIPLILGAGILELKDLSTSQINISYLVIAFIITFFVSLFSIKVLLKIVKSDKFYLFGIYNMIVGVVVLIFNSL